MPAPIFRVEQYWGQRDVAISATQQIPTGEASPADARRILEEWIEFFTAGPSPIRRLNLCSRVPQNLLESLAGQTQLQTLELKWGEYFDIAVLAQLTRLRTLSLGAAKKVADLSPLSALHRLQVLTVDQAFQAPDPAPISQLVRLRELNYGNFSLGSDKLLDVRDYEWIRPLRNLRVLHLAGTRTSDPDLSVLLELPRLAELGLPLRRDYRIQVLQNVAHSKVFTELAKGYEWLDAQA